MNLNILIYALFPLLFSAQDVQESNNDKVTFSYEAIKVPGGGSGIIGSSSNKAFASFINEKFPERDHLILNEIKFETINFNNKSSSVFLCLYENNNGVPGPILSHAKILVEIPAKKTIITTNISKLNIQLPPNGYFIGFEWIPTKENILNGTRSTSNKPYNPTIRGVSNVEANLFVLDGIWKKAGDQLVSEISFEVTYLSKLR